MIRYKACDWKAPARIYNQRRTRRLSEPGHNLTRRPLIRSLVALTLKKNIYKGGSEEGALNLMKIGRLIDKRSSIRQPLTVVEIIATSHRHRLNHEIDFEGKLSIFKRHSSLLMVLIWFSLISILSSAPRVSKLLSQTKCFNEARNGSDLIL